MSRQLQIKDGVVGSEWQGDGEMPVPPDASYTFLDVTDRPEARVGMRYDAAADTFRAAPVVPPAEDSLRADIRAIKAKLLIL